MMETRTREKGTIDRRLRGFVGTLDDVNPTRLSKRSQAVPLQEHSDLTYNLQTDCGLTVVGREHSDLTYNSAN